LSYNPGKVGWWEGFEWGEELGGEWMVGDGESWIVL